MYNKLLLYMYNICIYDLNVHACHSIARARILII